MPRGILTAALSLALLAPVLAQEDAVARDEAAIRLRIEVLKSDDPTTRDRAAAEIRALVAKHPGGTVNIREPDGGEARWRAKLAQIVPGTTPFSAIERLLQPMRLGATGGIGSGAYQRYVLDHHWQVTITYGVGRDGTPSVVTVKPTLERVGLIAIAAARPRDFTGEWIQYFANGEVASRATFKAGAVVGVARTYHDNGRPAGEDSYDPVSHLRDGPSRRWYRDGTHQEEGQYRGGVQVGRWQRWSEDGKPAGEETFDNTGNLTAPAKK